MSASRPGGVSFLCGKGGRGWRFCGCFARDDLLADFFRAAMRLPERVGAEWADDVPAAPIECARNGTTLSLESAQLTRSTSSMRKPISPRLHGALDYTT